MSDYRDGPAKEDALYKPFTLKRLTDYNPSERSEGSGRLISNKQLRDDVFENLDMLFNSRCHASLADLKGYQELEESVLGYGITDFCGRTSSTASRDELRDYIYQNIRFFEPRLDPDSIVVEFHESQKEGSYSGNDAGRDFTSLEYRISGVISVKDVKEEFGFISRLNLESGNADLRLEEK